jgi:hypothetical protein
MSQGTSSQVSVEDAVGNKVEQRQMTNGPTSRLEYKRNRTHLTVAGEGARFTADEDSLVDN